MNDLTEDLRIIEEEWDVVNDPEGRVAVAARRWAEFPSDEDVEAAINGWLRAGGYTEQVTREDRAIVRAALEAVKEGHYGQLQAEPTE